MSHSLYPQKTNSIDFKGQNKKILSSQQTLQQKSLQAGVLQSLAMKNPMSSNESLIFNDLLEGGVDPSINDSIRESIQCSFVSSEAGEQNILNFEEKNQEMIRDHYVMNRMNWITYLKVLFDQLESFNQNKQKHVENPNFLKGLRKIKNLLPLQPKNDYFKNCSDVAFTFKEVYNGIVHMPKYITWDNVIDVFLAKQYQTSILSANNAKNSRILDNIDPEDFYNQNQLIESSIHSSVKYEEGDVYDQSFQDNNQKKTQMITKSTKKDDDFFLSFADSVIKMQPGQFNNLANQQNQMNQSPFLIGTPSQGRVDKDEDEACEIDSDDSDNSQQNSTQNRYKRSTLEESIRSSRTATFKSIRHTSQNPQNIIQDQYYTTQSKKEEQKSKKEKQYNILSEPKQQSRSNSNNYYYTSGSQPVQKNKRDSSNEDDQVDITSNGNLSVTSSRRNVEEINQILEKSTRLSSQNSIQKNSINNNNNTLLSQGSSHSSKSSMQAKLQNTSKVSSAHQSQYNQQSSQPQILIQNTVVDIELQQKGLKNFEMDFRQVYGDKKHLRALNLAINSISKIPQNLEKSIQFMNISWNKLKSLSGIEQCGNLKFLNLSGNQISSIQGIGQLQNMKELICAHNQLSLIKEISTLKNLILLDLSYNKLVDYDKIAPIQSIKKLTVLSLIGNQVTKQTNYKAICKKLLSQVKVQDPPEDIKEFSSMQKQMEKFFFTDMPEQIINRQQELKRNDRSVTPNRDKSKSKLRDISNNTKITQKQSVVSPQKLTFASLNQLNSINQQSKEKVNTKKEITLSSLHKSGQKKEELKQEPRSRSTSNISRNCVSSFMRTAPSGKSPIQIQMQKEISKNLHKGPLIKNTTGRVTPQRSNMMTPRDQSISCFSKSICQTEEGSFNGTPKNNLKRKSFLVSNQQSSNIFNKTTQNLQITTTSPNSKTKQTNQIKNNIIANQKQHISQRKSTLQQQQQQQSSQAEQPIYVFPLHPMTSKNSQASFNFESGRQTPTSRPSSQLQKFITASNGNKKEKIVQKQQIPSVKVTNLPPKSYQSRIEKPGDKKIKADMSQSRLSMININKNESQQDISSRSMSPVCDESSNIKKMKVDLTQFIKKQ